MEFKHRKEGQTLRIEFTGNIIFEETSNVSRYLDGLLEEDFEEAVLSFSKVTGITSSAIGAVLDFYQKLSRRGRKMRIKGMSDKAYTVFKYFKLDDLLPIER